MPQIATITFRVRYAETDQMGVVYHANYFVWYEMGRVEFLRRLGFDYKQMEIADDCHLPVVEATSRYRSPAHYDDLLTLETRVAAVRASIVKFEYRLLRADASAPEAPPKLLAEGETMHVVVDKTMQKSRLPEKYATAIRAAM